MAGERFHVVTGGPGAGKSTLIEALAVLEYPHMPEAGRAIIRDQVEICGQALPWADRPAFAELMLSWELRSYRAAAAYAGPVLFDRGVPDVVGYLRLVGARVPEHVERAARLFHYHRKVFVAPPWPEIFARDAERKQTLEEAEATYHAVSGAYRDFGYELVEVPRVPMPKRVAFVRRLIDIV